MELNKLQAAKATGKSRTTLDRHISNGKLSSRKNGQGKVVIDVAELERVYGKVDINTMSSTASTEQNDTPAQNNNVQREIELRDEKIEALQVQLKQREDDITDYRRRLDESEAERRKVTDQITALLTHDRERKQKSDRNRSQDTTSGFLSLLRSLTSSK